MSIISGLLKEIYDFKPDVIYSVHFYGGIAITNLRLVYDIPCKVVVANLDYVNSPFWEGNVGIDYFIIPNQDFIKPSLKIGFREEQLKPLGLPVNEKFYLEQDKNDAREKLSLEKDVFTIMIMFGGGHWKGGFKIFKDVIKSLGNRKAQVIMINGRNKQDYETISKMKFADNIKVVNVGFTNQVDLYMAASDVILNKLGGTSATEMINKKLPIIVTEMVSGQERHNLEYLKSKGAALSFKNSKELQQILFKLMDDKDFYNQMVKNVLKLRINGIDNTAKFILSLPNAKYNQEVLEKIKFNQVFKNVQKARLKANKLEKKKK